MTHQIRNSTYPRRRAAVNVRHAIGMVNTASVNQPSHCPVPQSTVQCSHQSSAIVELMTSSPTQSASLTQIANLVYIGKADRVPSSGLDVVVQRDHCHQDERQNISDNVERRDLEPSRSIDSKRADRLQDADRHQVVPCHCRHCSPIEQPSAEPAPRPVRQPTSDPGVAVVRISALVAHCRLPADPHRNHLRYNSRNDWDLQPCDTRSRKARLPWMSHVRQEDHDRARDSDVTQHCWKDLGDVKLILRSIWQWTNSRACVGLELARSCVRRT